jgi:uncharacterized membrane protein
VFNLSLIYLVGKQVNVFAIVFSITTIFVHVLVFVIEYMLWLKPVIYERALSKLNVTTDASYYEQAKILEVLFINQGFYNMFVALGGTAGIVLYRLGKKSEGVTLVCYVCLFALGASLVLASSTTAYPAALVQGLPPALALLGLFFYQDYFEFYTPYKLSSMLDGKIGPLGPVTQYKLLGTSVVMAIPCLMSIFSVTLKPSFCRWLNIVVAPALIVILALVIQGAWYFYIFFCLIEIMLLLSVVWQAWKWPRSVIA